jgi:hypothetical protein
MALSHQAQSGDGKLLDCARRYESGARIGGQCAVEGAGRAGEKAFCAAHKLLGDIAMREKCLGKASAEYAAALAILKGDLMVG